MKNSLSIHNKNKKIDTLIENMTRYSAGIAELDIFDTFEHINTIDYINSERIKFAKKLLAKEKKSKYNGGSIQIRF